MGLVGRRSAIARRTVALGAFGEAHKGGIELHNEPLPDNIRFAVVDTEQSGSRGVRDRDEVLARVASAAWKQSEPLVAVEDGQLVLDLV